jgi:hypothetical protein
MSLKAQSTKIVIIIPLPEAVVNVFFESCGRVAGRREFSESKDAKKLCKPTTVHYLTGNYQSVFSFRDAL